MTGRMERSSGGGKELEGLVGTKYRYSEYDFGESEHRASIGKSKL